MTHVLFQRHVSVLTAVVLSCALVFSIVAGPTVAADTCHTECWWYDTEGACQYQTLVCEPEYEVWQSSEPNWCLYATNDRVAVQYTQGVGITGWYVWRAADYNPTSGLASLYVVNDGHGNCYLSPW
jgi:hypothetical protein